MPAALKKILKVLLWIFSSILLLLVIIILLIRMPAVQNYIVNKAEPILEEKTGTTFKIQRVFIAFPKNIAIQGVYVEDQKGDTLASIGNLEVNIGLLGLLQNEVNIDHVLLEHTTINLFKDSASGKFNFDFIIESFQQGTPPEKQKESSWEIFAGGLELHNIRFTYVDEVSKLNVKAAINALDLEMDKFDLDSMNFEADEFALSGANISVKSSGQADNIEKEEGTSGDTSKLSLAARKISINKSHFAYTDNDQQALAVISILMLDNNSFSLHNQKINAGAINLNQSFVHYQRFSSDTTGQKASPSEEESSSSPWEMNVSEVHFQENEIKFDNSTLPRDTVPSGIDFNHLHITNLNSRLRNIALLGTGVSVSVENINFEERSGFTLEHFATDFQMQGEKMIAKNFSLQTHESSIEAEATFFSTAFMEDTTGESPSHIHITEAIVHPQDIFYFVPSLQQQLSPGHPIRVEGQMDGWLSNLDIGNLRASADSAFIALRGQLTGLPEMHNFYFDIPHLTIQGNATSFLRLLPDTVLPQNLRFPEKLDVTASAKGSLNDLSGHLSGVTSMGNLYFEGSFRNDTIEKYVDLNGDLEIEQFNAGAFIQNPMLGIIDADFSVDGAGETLTNTDIQINGNIDLLQYNEYDYQKLKIDGNVQGKSYRGKLSSEDKNLWFYFNGLVDMQDSIPQFDLRLDLVNANLQALNFADQKLEASGVLTASIKPDDEGRINGEAAIRKAKVIKDKEFFTLDSMVLVSVSEKTKTDIKFNSGILNAELSGRVDVNRIGSILKHHVDQYFAEDLQPDSVENELQEFTFSVEMVDPTILTDVFLPDLDTLNISTIRGSFHNQENRLEVEVDIPQIRYSSLVIDTLQLNINSNNRQLFGNLSLALFKNDFIYIDDFSLDASSTDNALDLLAIIPLRNKRDFQLGGRLRREDGDYLFSLRPETLVFDGQQWTAPDDNYLRIGEGIWFHNFSMENGNKHLSINSRLNDAKDTTLFIDFQNFELASLTEPLSDTVGLVSGIVTGNFHLLSQYEGLSFNAQLNIANLHAINNPIGNLNLSSNYRRGANEVALAITGDGADLSVNGLLSSQDTNTNLEGRADIRKLELSVIYPFVKENFEKLHGKLAGNITFKTTEALPEIEGRVNFHEVNIIPSLTGVELNIDNEEIRIDNERIVLNNFKVNAADNGSLILDGTLNAGNFPSYNVVMNLTAENFLVLNTTDDVNEMYYGKLRIGGTAGVKGDENLLDIQANMKVVGGSELVYVVPQQQASVISGEGLVRYINIGRDTSLAEYAEMREDTVEAHIQGIDLTANIAIDKESKMSVIIDQQTGDRLDVAGDANLTLRMPPNADLSLAGRYEISEGSYKLNFYEFVKREFEIVKGSYILWTGDPLEAQLDVHTRYVVETLPPLSDINRRLPFHVNLRLQDKILDPELSFNLSLPEDLQQEYSNVSSFLQNNINNQETELNKQVFSLIVFNSFMISGGTGSGDIVSNTARQSLSKILSQQLNKLAGNLNFVELDVNLESYETGSTESAQGRTDLELGLSKSLFNDRVVVRVEGNVNLEGEESRQQGMSNYAGDIIIEYKLTPDGVYRLQVFSKDEYDPLDQGDITKTGVGVIMIRDYNHLKELFRRDKKSE